MADSEDLGSLGGGLQDPVTTSDSSVPPEPCIALPDPQPVNQATMVCLRGPCVHLWQIIKRFETSVDNMKQAEMIRTCTGSGYDTELDDQRIYWCDRWWPQAPLRDDDGKVLLAVPRTFMEERGLDRPPLHQQWEEALAKLGYDFSWRTFDPATFFSDDDPHQRKFSGFGGYEAARVAAQNDGLPPGGSIPEDDDA